MRIYYTLENPNLAFVIRDPIERAYSQYYYYLHRGKISPEHSFIESIRKNEWNIVDRGIYIRYIDKFEEVFGRESMKFILTSDLGEGGGAEVAEFAGATGDFDLNVQEEHNVTQYPKSRVLYALVRKSWHTIRDTVESTAPGLTDSFRQMARHVLFNREKPPMSDEARAYLKERYAEPNARLEDYLGRDLSHWT